MTFSSDRMKGAVLISLTLLSACVAPVSGPIPLVASGPVAIDQGGVGYIADLEPVAGGAVLAITRDAPAFGYADGLVAKRVADQFCASRGSRVNPQAYGHYTGGAWLFKGGCA